MNDDNALCCHSMLLSCGSDGNHVLGNVDQDKAYIAGRIFVDGRACHSMQPEGQAVVCGSGLSLYRI